MNYHNLKKNIFNLTKNVQGVLLRPRPLLVLSSIKYRNLIEAKHVKNVETTALHNVHLKNGGKMVDFSGYALPIFYSDQNLNSSHLFTRQSASIFDVSHMLQTYVYGRDAIKCFESICTANISAMSTGGCSLTVFTNEFGGILDDLIVTKVDNDILYVVSNASMKEQDKNIMNEAMSSYKSEGKDVHFEFLPLSEQSLVAIQGPKTISAIGTLISQPAKLDKLFFMNSITDEIAGIKNCRITRCGYTGEDGVEISVSSDKAEHLVNALLDIKYVKLAGLGVRDSLRLEAGLCLYGVDINSEISPIEADLGWLISKRRRSEANFPGASNILNHINNGVTRRRIGLQMINSDEKRIPPARNSTEILYENNVVGHITSGLPSPTLSRNIAMGFIDEKLKSNGTIVQLKIRGKLFDAEITKMPFVKTNYFLRSKILK